MGILINDTDFVGKWAVSQNNYTQLAEYIDRYEEKYLAELLGVTLKNLFVADLSAQVPQSAIYLAIYNPFEEDYNRTIVRSSGMKNMLLGFIYFEYLRDMKYSNTVSGTVVHENEVSRESTFDESNLYGRFNESVIDWEAIQWKIKQTEEADYPDYNGMARQITHWAL